MTVRTLRDAAAFPAMVTAAFFVRNALLISVLLVALLLVLSGA